MNWKGKTTTNALPFNGQNKRTVYSLKQTVNGCKWLGYPFIGLLIYGMLHVNRASNVSVGLVTLHIRACNIYRRLHIRAIS